MAVEGDAAKEPLVPDGGQGMHLPSRTFVPTPDEDDISGSSDSPGSRVKETPFAVEAMQATLSAAQGRCGLLAGFSYYELSRQSPSTVEAMPQYALAMLLVFSFAVTSTALAVLVKTTLRQVQFKDWERYSQRVQLIVNCSYACFFLSGMFWIGALSLIGFAYNAPAEDGPQTVNVLGVDFDVHILPHIPCYIFSAAGICCVLFTLYLAVTTKSIQSSECREKCPVTNFMLTDVSTRFTSRTSAASDRTMYLLGFTGAGLARYKLALVLGGEAHERLFNVIFWILMNIAGALLALTMVCGTHATVVMFRLPSEVRHGACRRVSWAATFLTQTIRGGTMCVVASGAFIGWGVSMDCNSTDTGFDQSPLHGVCFGRLAWIPFGICGCTCVLGVLIGLYTWSCARHAKREFLRKAEEVINENRVGQDENYVPDTDGDDGEALVKVLDGWAGQAMLFSGFVFYNIACFDTDILHAPITADYVRGIRWDNILFLVVTLSAFAFGMTTVLISVSVSGVQRSFDAVEGQRLFVQQLPRFVRWGSNTLSVALYCFMASFSLIGFVKMVPARPEPFIVTGLCVLGMANDNRSLRRALTHAESYQGSLRDLGSWHDGLGLEHKSTAERIQAQSKIVAPQALFFGAFAYNGVNFLFRPEAALAPAYSAVMGGCFMLSLVLVLKESTVSIGFLHFVHNKAKYECYGRRLILPLRSMYQDYRRTYQMFMLAIALMGPVKLFRFEFTTTVLCAEGSFSSLQDVISPHCQLLGTPAKTKQEGYSLEYGTMITLVGILGLIFGFLFISFFERTAMNTAIEMKKVQDARGDRCVANALHRSTQQELNEDLLDPFEDIANNASLQVGATTFQTGNVFYEVLFTTISPGNPIRNYVYLGFSVITLLLGCLAIILGSGICIWMEDFPNKRSKSAFAKTIQPTLQILSLLSKVSLMTWLAAMLASSAVKYGDEYANFSLVTCGGALVVIVLAIIFVNCSLKDYEVLDGSQGNLTELNRQLVVPLWEMMQGFVGREPALASQDPKPKPAPLGMVRTGSRGRERPSRDSTESVELTTSHKTQTAAETSPGY